MKVQGFLKLVEKMRTAQVDYYKARRQPNTSNAMTLLIQSKELEKAVDAVIKAGRLEPDIVSTVEIKAPIECEECQLQLNLIEEKPCCDGGEYDEE